MSLELDLDLEGIDLDQEEKGSGGLPAGWYPARVADAYEDHKNPGTLVMEFTIADGPHRGRKHTERLFSPLNADNEDKAKTASRRMGVFAVRLGLLPRNATGNVRPDWSRAVGQDVVLHIVRRKYKDKNDNEKEVSNIDFAGLFMPGDERIPEAARGRANSGAAAPGSSGSNPPPSSNNGVTAPAPGGGTSPNQQRGATGVIDYSTL